MTPPTSIPGKSGASALKPPKLGGLLVIAGVIALFIWGWRIAQQTNRTSDD